MKSAILAGVVGADGAGVVIGRAPALIQLRRSPLMMALPLSQKLVETFPAYPPNSPPFPMAKWMI